MSHLETIDICGACENNLKNLSLSIPKHQITVFTGVSGSGKSSLVIDTIAAQSRRELNDTFPSFTQQYLPKYGRPHVERITGLPVAIVIDQRKPANNVRSTLGTYSDIYAPLRLLFSRVGRPFVGYSDSFSFNHPQGRCPRCDGLGEVSELDVHKLVDFDKSLNESGVIHYIAFEPGQWRWQRYAYSGLFDLDKKIRDYTPQELELFFYSPQIKLKDPPANWPRTAKYEGLVHRMYRSIIRSEEGKLHQKLLEPMLTMGTCPDCGGARLNERVLSCRICGKNIAEVTHLPLPEVLQWLEGIDDPLAEDLKHTLAGRLQALCEIGLGYLSLDRGIGTLSGGEAQRCKIAKYSNSPLSDVLYILDEPSVGLHPHDIRLLKESVQKLRDHGNTVLLVEHHKEMISLADHIVELGPGAGAAGGEILFQGSYPELLAGDTLTGRMLSQKLPLKPQVRSPKGWITLEQVSKHNLQAITLHLPLGVLAVVAGVAGSGKSSLMEAFREAYPQEVVYIGQHNIGISLRSTPATYLGVSDDIRQLFAKRSGAGVGMFSFNGKGGCPVCGGKGVVVSDMAFMDSIETVCEACGGLRYSPQALAYRVDGLDIAQVMDLTVRKAMARFPDTAISEKLRPLAEVGLGYLHLNQALSTLSGGELQRVKLASYLDRENSIFVLDEPTDGLHPKDIQEIIGLFGRMVDRGNSLFLVEHNLDVLKAADHLIELGPGAGRSGGRLLFAGVPAELLNCTDSVTAPYLAKDLAR